MEALRPACSKATLIFGLQPCGRTPVFFAWALRPRHYVQVEAELRELDPAEAEEYLQSLGASEGGLTSLISAAYRQLGLLTYFTTGAFP